MKYFINKNITFVFLSIFFVFFTFLFLNFSQGKCLFFPKQDLLLNTVDTKSIVNNDNSKLIGDEIVKIQGVIKPLSNPSPQDGYNYQINPTVDFYEYIGEIGGRTKVNYVVVFSVRPDVFKALEQNIGKEVVLTGYIEWGMGETRHINVINILPLE